METNHEMVHLSTKRCLSLLVLYFIGYTYMLPRILTVLTLAVDPHATTFNIPISTLSYVLLMIVFIWIAWPVWKDSLKTFKANWKRFLPLVFLLVFLVIVANYGLNVIVSILTSTSDSENQKVIVDNAVIAPFFTIFSSVIYAPIVEETVFRSGVFTWLRKRMNMVWATLFSALVFGGIHVMDSLFAGNFLDVTYLVLYAGIGIVLAIGYEKSNSVVVSVLIHMCNNILAVLSLFLTM